MPISIAQNSFAGGEIAPALWGRSDLAKYRSGAAYMRNFFADYRGGAVSRPGTRYVGMGQANTQDRPRLVPFLFNDAQTYMLELSTKPNGDSRMRIIDRCAYVTVAAVNVTAVALGAATEITAAGHGATVQDDFYITGITGCVRTNGINGLNGRQLRVGGVVGNVITASDEFAAAIDSTTWTAYASGGQLLRIYSVDVPWDSEDFFALNFTQQADIITVTHPDYRSYNIMRNQDGTWSVEAEVFGSSLAPPTNVVAEDIQGEGPDFDYAYVVTTFDPISLDESEASVIATVVNEALDQIEGVANRITWTPADGAGLMYRIYKAPVVPHGQGISVDQGVWGLIGETSVPFYIDINYEPDFTRSPPISFNPFAEGAIVDVEVTDGGQGYIDPQVAVDVGSGASLIAVARSSGPGDDGVADPFGEITSIVLANGGQDYTTATTATITDAVTATGSGATLSFSGSWVDLGGGNFAPAPGSITIVNGGENYHRFTASGILATATLDPITTLDIATTITNGGITALNFPTNVALTTNTASDLTFTIADLGAADGAITIEIGTANNPRCVAYFQQRKFYAGGDAPRGFFGSRPGQFTNFDYSYPSQAVDPIIGFVVGRDVNEILSLVEMSNGMIAFTSSKVFLISGGSSRGAITPNNATAIPQSSVGAAPLVPLVIGNDIIYLQARGSAVSSINYDFYRDGLNGEDLTQLAQHLLPKGVTIVDWCWSREPWRILWAVRSDGVLLSFTYVPGQEVYAWAHHDTLGRFISVATVPECNEDAVFVIVERPLGDGAPYYVTERMASRMLNGNLAGNMPATTEGAWCVDNAVNLPLTFPAGTLSVDTVEPPGQIYAVTVEEGGSGYGADPVVTVDDPTGTGAVLTATVVAGAVTAITIVDGGEGYTHPLITVVDDGGEGATFTIELANLMVLSTTGVSVGAADAGKCLRFGGGSGTVITGTTTSEITVNMEVMPHSFYPNDPRDPTRYTQITFLEGEWSLTEGTTVVGGFDHLRGAYITGVADGVVIPPQLVNDGAITLDEAATSIVAGLGYTCQLMTLGLELDGDELDGRRKAIPACSVRTVDTERIRVGPRFTMLNEIIIETDIDDEAPARNIPFSDQGGGYSAPNVQTNGAAAISPIYYNDHRLVMDSMWQEAGLVCIEQDYPLPAMILDIVPLVNVGDDEDRGDG